MLTIYLRVNKLGLESRKITGFLCPQYGNLLLAQICDLCAYTFPFPSWPSVGPSQLDALPSCASPCRPITVAHGACLVTQCYGIIFVNGGWLHACLDLQPFVRDLLYGYGSPAIHTSSSTADTAPCVTGYSSALGIPHLQLDTG